MRTSQLCQSVDLSASAAPLDRYFLAGIGSCHAYLTLREDWRKHARLIQREIGFRSVRTHSIFHDLVGIYPNWPGEIIHYNFQNLDKIYDFWLSQSLKPYVELGFTPSALASGEQTIFQYRANVTPPKDMPAWNDLIHAFVTHVIDRYGLSEVLTWRFEVWNEPDLDGFWAGSQAQYFDYSLKFETALPHIRAASYRYSFKLCSTAYAAASARLLTPSLDRILLT